MDDIRQEFWGDLQVDLYTANTAVYLADQSLEDIISVDGRKAHKPILSHAQTGTYTPHNDINFEQKKAEKQTLEVDTFEYAAEDIDITESSQTPYDLQSHSLRSIRKGLMNRVEQKFLSEISNAGHNISGAPVDVSGMNILDIIEEADGELGAADAPLDTAMKAFVIGPKTTSKLRRAKSERESRLGDSVLENGVIGAWQGWTVVQNNNLPWSAKLGLATNPTNGDSVTIQGVKFTFVSSIGSTPGNVLIGANAGATRANLKAAVEGGAGAGTTYVELSIRDKFKLRRRRYVRCDANADMAFTGFGDISVRDDLTDATDGWKNQEQQSIFMVRGAIDLVIQLMDLKVSEKEKGFADLTKGIIGIGAKTFYDGQDLMVRLTQDASKF